MHSEAIRGKQSSHQNLPNLVDIPLRRPQHNSAGHRPFDSKFFNSGSSTAIAARIASAEAIMSGKRILPWANWSPTAWIPGT
jgi:hypothetical protein